MDHETKQPGDPSSVVLCPDGPILIRGDFEIVTPSGDPVPRHRNTVALCRCGASAIKPYCDGSHKLIKFRTGIAGTVDEDS
ncbi:CDGSH iron-sulfur domain-containing protein [Arthrobacter globiformis]|uniref:CDGSH iron-sulfur domain-containing protein n=1 Tax=Arthrobacter globiformis TaxID=1665 RepID=UPI00278F1A50|nr:CDGSH iron-sulfur domain-containing protein [Arthrobacter globiformis]MDQ0620200.1 CDGSH-type Zn-finger protein [Arthrobacter globiformis]